MFNFGNISGSNNDAFDPVKDIPPLDGKVILVTGGSAGLGKQAIAYLAQHNPAQVWLAVPDMEEAEAACTDICEQAPQADLRILPLDLASLDAVKQAAATFLVRADRLDILMLNAGVMAVPPGLTEDGFEKQFGINHMGHALLTKLLLPLLTKTASAGDVRVIVVTSYSHWNAPEGGIDFDTLRTPAEHLTGSQRYAQSKLANILFARHLASLYPSLTVAAVHPGAADTNLHANATDSRFVDRIINRYVYRFLLFSSLGTAAKHQVWAATTKEGLRSGEYYEPLGIAGGGRPEGKDPQLAQKLWDWTEAELLKVTS
jgi:NAD(P)-dependent dehydrogenase (short-subunit alcohol dehydrogenase family)